MRISSLSLLRSYRVLLLTVAAFMLHSHRSIAQPAKQSAKADSLTALLKTAKHDTTRAVLYIALASTDDLHPDSVIGLCNKAISIIDRNLGKADQQRQYSLLCIRAVRAGIKISFKQKL